MLFILGAIYIRNPTPVVSAAHVAKFFANVIKGMAEVARIGHVWIASLIGAFQFGVMLAAGVVWAPKLLVVHGFSPSTADRGASMLWLGLAMVGRDPAQKASDAGRWRRSLALAVALSMRDTKPQG